MNRVSICVFLLNRNKIVPISKRIVTGDETWVTYDNVKRKRSWLNRAEQALTKPGLTGKSCERILEGNRRTLI